MAATAEIRGTWKQRLVGRLASWLMRLLGWTLRYRVTGLEQITGKYGDQPVVFAHWHNKIIAMPPITSTICTERPLVVLTSASKDGAVLEYAVRGFGIDVVRGSSSRRGVAALIELRKVLKLGKHICITPDGPRGPMQVLQPGIIKIAQTSGSPVVALNTQFVKYWQLNTWDKFCIPKPYSKVYIKLEDAVEVPKELEPEEFENYRLKVESLLNKEYDHPKN